MKKFLLVALATTVLCSSPAFAESAPAGSSSSEAAAKAIAAAGAIAGASGGNASNSTQVGLTANPTATAGSSINGGLSPVANSNTGPSSASLDFHPTTNVKQAPGAGTAISPGLVASAIFTPPNPQANAIGAPMIYSGLRACQDKLGTGVDSIDSRFEDGVTGRTEITYDSLDQSSLMPKGRRAGNPWGATVLYDMPEVVGKCAGFVQITAKAGDARRVTWATEVGDMKKFIEANVRSSTGMYIVALPQSISMATVMDTRSTGLGASASASGFVGIGQTLLTGALGGAKSTGFTAARSEIGDTFLVIIPDSLPVKTPKLAVRLDELGLYYPPVNQVPTGTPSTNNIAEKQVSTK